MRARACETRAGAGRRGPAARDPEGNQTVLTLTIGPIGDLSGGVGHLEAERVGGAGPQAR